MVQKINIDKFEKLTFLKSNKKFVFKPVYSTKRSLEQFNTLIDKFVSTKSAKAYIYKNFNVLPTIYEDLHWRYSFGYIKYKEFFEKFRVTEKTHITNELEWEDGISDYLYFYKGDSFKQIVKLHLKKVAFIFWIIEMIFRSKKNKIWIDVNLTNDFRYNFKEILNMENYLVLFGRWGEIRSPKYKSKNINDAIENLIKAKCNSNIFWRLAIKLLKPKRIICKDNLFYNYSLLLAAKVEGIEIVGVSHGSASFWHRGITGAKKFSKDQNQLRFSKYYAWTPEMVSMVKRYGSLYLEKEIFLSGWLQKIEKIPKKYEYEKSLEKDLVLYPFEWWSNYPFVYKKLKEINISGYKIIMKKRADVVNYNHYNDLNIEYVNDFENHHYKRCLCVVGSASAILYQYSIKGIPVYIFKNDGFNFFQNIFHPDWEYFTNIKEIKTKRKNNYGFKKIEITKDFINEFF